MWLCAKTMGEFDDIDNSVDEYKLIEKWVDVLKWRNDAYANAYCWAVTKVIDASEPHWINEDYVNPNELSNAVCDMYDVKNAIKSLGLNDELKDNDGTEITIGDCIHDILLFLEELEENSPYKDEVA
tara:strand:- start:97 stop:477 length:381 start_codon:yes stop_codon:yes gene_type:complete